LQLDFDVLSTNSLPAVDFPHPGGLNWEQLDRLTTAGFTTDNNVGWNVTINNPDLDSERKFARRIVQFIACVMRYQRMNKNISITS
jgi:arginase